jgi:Mg2+ and Co2+ transporter CorA
MLSNLLHYFSHQPPGFEAAKPSILSLGYYPIRIILAEWNLYTYLMSRYFNHYEYALHDNEKRLHDNDIVNLQRWRRRSIQSRHKLTLVSEFIDYWLQEEADKQPWNVVLKDIKHTLSQLDRYNRSLEHMIPVATSMVQLLDSRRSTQDAANLGRLTLIALVFVPLSWVASLFSMSEDYSPQHKNFWVYLTTAVPVLIVLLLLSAVQLDRLVVRLERIRAVLRGQRAGGFEAGLA